MAKRRVRRNVEMGFWRGGVFHPIRSSDDYEPDTVGERYQYKPAKKKKTKKKKNSARSRRLMRSGSKKLAAWVRAQAKKNRGRRKKNPSRVAAGLKRSGSTGFLKAKAVNVITRSGKIVEVKVKR